MNLLFMISGFGDTEDIRSLALQENNFAKLKVIATVRRIRSLKQIFLQIYALDKELATQMAICATYDYHHRDERFMTEIAREIRHQQQEVIRKKEEYTDT